MRTLNSLLVILLLSVFTLAITSCGNKAKSEKANTEQSTETAEQGPEYTSAYICPMHCKGSGSDKAGKCPVCNMDYKKNENHQHDNDGHNHDGHDDAHEHEGNEHEGHDHEGHNH